MIYYGSKMDVAGFATALQLRFGKDSQLTTITRVGKSAVYSVSIATDTSSEGTVVSLAQNYSLRRTNTFPGHIPDGLYRKE